MKKLFQKILTVCAIIIATCAVFNLVTPETTFADSASGGYQGNCRSFLGLTSWDCGVDIHNENSLKSGIWTIITNVLSDITIIAAYLVLGYVIYGGYLYTFSGGDAGKVVSGRKTLSHAFTGLIIIVAANLIIGTIRAVLVGGSIADCATRECVDESTLFTNLIQWVIGIAGVVSLIFIVYGGISYTISMGDSGKVQKAKNMILYALIGLAIVALSEAIVIFVSNLARDNITGDETPQSSLIVTQKELS